MLKFRKFFFENTNHYDAKHHIFWRDRTQDWQAVDPTPIPACSMPVPELVIYYEL